MYNLTEKQFSKLDSFVDSLEESMVKSKAKVIADKVRPTLRITAELLENFVSLSTHLPREFQNFPQEFALSLRSGNDMEDADETEEVKKKETKKKK
jgi:hypothetical protein